jgi:hypothetical protein
MEIGAWRFLLIRAEKCISVSPTSYSSTEKEYVPCQMKKVAWKESGF